MGEVAAFQNQGRDDLFFSIAEKALTKAVTQDIESYLGQIASLAEEGGVFHLDFTYRIVPKVVDAAKKILWNLEDAHRADLTASERILNNPEYKRAVEEIVRKKLNHFLKLFAARNINVSNIYRDVTSPCQSGKEYEDQVGKVFDNSGWVTIKTPATGDQGADLICTKANFKLVVQCKFYSGNVGNAAVQEIHAAKSFYGANLGAVVSNAGFTRSAIALAEKLQVLLITDDKLERFANGR